MNGVWCLTRCILPDIVLMYDSKFQKTSGFACLLHITYLVTTNCLNIYLNQVCITFCRCTLQWWRPPINYVFKVIFAADLDMRRGRIPSSFSQTWTSPIRYLESRVKTREYFINYKGPGFFRGRMIWINAHPLPQPLRRWARLVTHRKTVKEIQLVDGRVGRQ